MKQKGDTWRDAQGAFVAKKYVNKESKAFEDLGQRMASEALDLEKKINGARAKLIELVEKALAASTLVPKPEKKFTFYTFDRGFKIEYDIVEKWVRVYRATCSNPKPKDYAPIMHNLNHNIKVEKPVVIRTTTVDEMNPEGAEEAKKIWDESAPQNENGQGIMPHIEAAAATGALDYNSNPTVEDLDRAVAQAQQEDVRDIMADAIEAQNEQEYIEQEILSNDRELVEEDDLEAQKEIAPEQ